MSLTTPTTTPTTSSTPTPHLQHRRQMRSFARPSWRGRSVCGGVLDRARRKFPAKMLVGAEEIPACLHHEHTKSKAYTPGLTEIMSRRTYAASGDPESHGRPVQGPEDAPRRVKTPVLRAKSWPMWRHFRRCSRPSSPLTPSHRARIPPRTPRRHGRGRGWKARVIGRNASTTTTTRARPPGRSKAGPDKQGQAKR